ncbi:MAG TPA: hypothetical protein PKA82_07605 [Pyrinomonadaceae bacterium]|nr:hypothetical protein [Pyrinomonadaceae bacterium]
MTRLVVSFFPIFLAILIAISSFFLIACNSVNGPIYRLPVYPKPLDHSAENNSPYSVVEGENLRIKPFEATFAIPPSWITYQPISIEPDRNLYLSWQDLNELEKFDFNHSLGFDINDALVIRTALPYSDCAAHIGSMSWGNGNSNDLQVRVFVVEATSQEITDGINSQGLTKAKEVFDEAKLKSGYYGPWKKEILSVLETGSHTLLFKDLTFYHREFENNSVVFVFIHQSGWDETIQRMLTSFKWKA